MLEVRPRQVDKSTNTDPELAPPPSTKVEMPKKAVGPIVAERVESEIGTLPPRRRSSTMLVDFSTGRNIENAKEIVRAHGGRKGSGSEPSPSLPSFPSLSPSPCLSPSLSQPLSLSSAGSPSPSLTALQHESSSELHPHDGDEDSVGGASGGYLDLDEDEEETEDEVNDLLCPAGLYWTGLFIPLFFTQPNHSLTKLSIDCDSSTISHSHLY
jgi:hypothetical protein